MQDEQEARLIESLHITHSANQMLYRSHEPHERTKLGRVRYYTTLHPVEHMLHYGLGSLIFL